MQQLRTLYVSLNLADCENSCKHCYAGVTVKLELTDFIK